MLLETAAPDAVARLPAGDLKDQARKIWDIYFYEQKHSSLAALMSHVLTSDDFHLNQMKKEGLLMQVSILPFISFSFTIWAHESDISGCLVL